MADETKTDKVTLEELMVSNVAMTEALTKLLIAKGVITDEEFKTQLSAERAKSRRSEGGAWLAGGCRLYCVSDRSSPLGR